MTVDWSQFKPVDESPPTSNAAPAPVDWSQFQPVEDFSNVKGGADVVNAADPTATGDAAPNFGPAPANARGGEVADELASAAARVIPSLEKGAATTLEAVPLAGAAVAQLGGPNVADAYYKNVLDPYENTFVKPVDKGPATNALEALADAPGQAVPALALAAATGGASVPESLVAATPMAESAVSSAMRAVQGIVSEALPGATVAAIPGALDQERADLESGKSVSDTAKDVLTSLPMNVAANIAPLSAEGSLASRAAQGATAQSAIVASQDVAAGRTPTAQDLIPAAVMGAGFGASHGHEATPESAQAEAVRLVDAVAKTKAAQTPPEVATAAAAGDPVAQGMKAAGDIIGEAKAKAAMAHPDIPAPIATPETPKATTEPVGAPPITAEPIASGSRVLFRGDVDQIKAQLADAGLPAGMTKLENGEPVGVYYPASYGDSVSKALGIGDSASTPELAKPTTEKSSAVVNDSLTTPGIANSIEAIRNGSKVLFRGDVDAMRERLTAAGLDPGYAQVENGEKVGIYFPKTVADKVAAVLKPEPAAEPALYSRDNRDAPNFGMPDPSRALPDDHPLLQPQDQNMSPERVAMRNDLVEQRFQGKAPVPEGQRPVALVMGGGGASGKGTILKGLRRDGMLPENAVELDPDSFKTGDAAHGMGGLPEYHKIVESGDSRAAAVTHEESSGLYKQALQKGIDGRYNMVLDRTMANSKKGLAELQALKDKGYEVRFVGATVDPGEAVNRAVARAQGPEKRFVPVSALLEAHKGFSNAVEHYVPHTDVFRMYDNNVARGEDPHLIASGVSGQMEIHDPERYNRFVGKGRLNEQATTHRELEASPGPRQVESLGRQVQAGNNGGGGEGAGRGREQTAPPLDSQESLKSKTETPPPSGVSASRDPNAAAESAAEQSFGKIALNKLKRNGVEFKTRAEIVAEGIGGHTSEDQLRGVKGITTGDRGRAVIVSDNVKPSEVAGVLAHEVFHKNAEAFIGSEPMRKLTDAVQKLVGKDKDITAAAAKVPADTPAKYRGEETAAYLAEDAPTHPLAQRLLDQAKLFLNKMGVPLDRINANAAAVRRIAALSLHDLANKEAPTHYMGEGRPDVLRSTAAPEVEHGQDNSHGQVKAPSPIVEKAKAVADDLLMKVAPMATGSHEARAVAKDFANTMREARWEGVHADKELTKNFSHDRLEAMWRAADKESVAAQQGHAPPLDGMASLHPAEREAVLRLQARAEQAFAEAKALGMVKGEGLPSYVPRMVVDMGKAGVKAFGRGEEGDRAGVIQNIRTLPMATAKLEEAIAGRTLVNAIKDIGDRTGQETVREGAAPVRRPESSGGGNVRTSTGNLQARKHLTTEQTEAAANAKRTAGEPEHKWFTIDHPAFKTWKPRMETNAEGKTVAVKDANGNPIMDAVPIYVRDDFKGPLKSIIAEKDGAIYSSLMGLKAKTMGIIMYSPMIHNLVELGRALPAMPGKVITLAVYRDGNRAKQNPETMREAIQAGLVPIGGHGGGQDLTSIQEGANLTPGQSWTAKLLAAVPGLFDKRAGDAVKRAVDAMGDVWHNKLLWDRIGDLQMGLYTNLRDRYVAKGMDDASATKLAAHLANRFAGALPAEAMSTAARKVANLTLFSRSFTFGNLGVLKDALTGLPRDVQAQILRDSGQAALKTATSLGRRKAIAAVVLDTGLMYLGNSILQSGIAVLSGVDWKKDMAAGAGKLASISADIKARGAEEMQGYVRRFNSEIQNLKENPEQLLNPFKWPDAVNSFTPQGDNEPGKRDRVLIGHTKDGTAVYMRNPMGKIGEEFLGWSESPLAKAKSKLSTFAAPAYETIANDKGYGQKVYDPYDQSNTAMIKNAGRIATLFLGDQVPLQAMQAAKDYYSGVGNSQLNAAQVLAPFAGVTFSKGAPGGEAIGELYAAKDEHEFKLQEALPGIRKLIQAGNTAEARQQMTDLGVEPGLQRYYLKTTLDPNARLSKKGFAEFMHYASPEDKQNMARARAAQSARNANPDSLSGDYP